MKTTARKAGFTKPAFKKFLRKNKSRRFFMMNSSACAGTRFIKESLKLDGRCLVRSVYYDGGYFDTPEWFVCLFYCGYDFYEGVTGAQLLNLL